MQHLTTAKAHWHKHSYKHDKQQLGTKYCQPRAGEWMKQQLTLWGVCILVVGHPSHLGGIVGALSHVVLGYLLMVVANCVTHRLPVVRPTPMMGHAGLVWPTHPRVLCVPGPARGHGGSGHHQRRGWTGQWGQVCRKATNSTTNTLPQVAVWTKRQAHKQKQKNIQYTKTCRRPLT